MLIYKVYYRSSRQDLEMTNIIKIGEQSCIYAIGHGTNEMDTRSVASNGITIGDLGNTYNSFIVPVRVYGIK